LPSGEKLTGVYSPPVVELAVIPSGGGPAIKKFQVPGFMGTLRWSPDGKALHYVLTSNGASNICEQSLRLETETAHSLQFGRNI